MSLPKMWSLFGADHLPYRLLLLARMIDRQASRQLQQEFDITLAEWRVLAFVCAAGPATASTVGHSGGIDRAEISRAVAKLEGKALVSRQPDPFRRLFQYRQSRYYLRLTILPRRSWPRAFVISMI